MKKSNLPPPKFKKGDIVYFDDDEDDFGLITAKIKRSTYISHPEHWSGSHSDEPEYVYEFEVLDPPDIELSYGYVGESLLSRTKPKIIGFYDLEWKK